jgi:hypothetical protein
LAAVTTREPHGPGGVDPESGAAPDEEAAPVDPAALLDRWQSHVGEERAPATVSALDEARTRREPPPEPEPELVEPTPLRPTPAATTPPAEPVPEPVRRPAPRHAAPRRAARDDLPAGRATDSVLAGREVLDALGRTAPPEAPAPKHAAAPPAPPAAAAPRGPEVGPSLNVDFDPRLRARRLVGLLLLVSLAATGLAAWLAYDDPRPITLGAAGTLLALTLLLYAVRAGSAPTYLAIRSGQLEVRRGKTLEKFDLTSQFTRIEVVGTPGRPGWKVLFGRFGRDPLVITSSLVDAKQFSAELERYRPRDRS